MIENESMRAILTELHYPDAWLKSSFLHEDMLREQIERHRVEGGYSTEHKRHAAFISVLKTRTAMNASEIAQYVKLATLDENQTIATSALIDLINWPGLSDQQLDWVSNHSAFTEHVIQRTIKRQQLLRELQSHDLTDDLFSRCILSGDAIIQRAALAKGVLSKQQLEALAHGGASRAVRNIAGQKARTM